MPASRVWRQYWNATATHCGMKWLKGRWYGPARWSQSCRPRSGRGVPSSAVGFDVLTDPNDDKRRGLDPSVLDTLNPDVPWGSEMIQRDGKKNYPDEFKRDAVALYRDTEGATIEGDRCRARCQRGDTVGVVQGRRVAIRTANPRRPRSHSTAARLLSSELARLRAENKALRATEATIVHRTGHSGGRRRNISPGRRTGEPLPSSSPTTRTPSR